MAAGGGLLLYAEAAAQFLILCRYSILHFEKRPFAAAHLAARRVERPLGDGKLARRLLSRDPAKLGANRVDLAQMLNPARASFDLHRLLLDAQFCPHFFANLRHELGKARGSIEAPAFGSAVFGFGNGDALGLAWANSLTSIASERRHRDSHSLAVIRWLLSRVFHCQ